MKKQTWSVPYSCILYQYHHQHVTQPLLLEQLHDIGVDISSGKLSQLLTHDLDEFHAEKADLLHRQMTQEHVTREKQVTALI